MNARDLGFPQEDPTHELALADDAATRALGRALAALVRPGEVLGLVGTLGAGKTTLMQGMIGALDLGDASSPTYTLINLHEPDDPGAPRLAHIDLYRLETYDDLESIGYWDVAGDPDTITCVEWLNRIPEAWPDWGRARTTGTLVCLDRAEGGRIARVWCDPARPLTL